MSKEIPKMDKEDIKNLKQNYDSIASLYPELKGFFFNSNQNLINRNLDEIKKLLHCIKFFSERMLKIVFKRVD